MAETGVQATMFKPMPVSVDIGTEMSQVAAEPLPPKIEALEMHDADCQWSE